MTLKKPSDFFIKESDNNNKNNFIINVSDDGLQDEINRVQNLSEQISQLQKELSQKVIQNDLEKIVLAQITTMQENFKILEENLKESNEEDITNISLAVSELSNIIENLLKNDIPKYKKQVTENEIRFSEEFNQFKEEVNQNNDKVKEELETVVQEIDGTLQSFSEHIEGTTEEVKRTSNTYNKLSNILEKKINEENEKLESYSQNINTLYEKFVEFRELFEERNTKQQKTIEETFESINLQVENKFESIDEHIDGFKSEVSLELSNIKADVVVNEQHLKSFKNTIKEYDEKLENVDEVFLEYDNRLENVDRYLKDNYKDLVLLKEEVLSEIKNLSNVDLLEDIERLEIKIDYIRETYSKIKPEVIVREVITEGLLNEPPETKNSDPLTPLDKKFVTFEQLQQHYRLFINRIQQQISTLGGGGETRLEFLDDIDRTSAKVDGKVLRYDGTLKKWVGVDGGGGNAGIASYALVSGVSTALQNSRDFSIGGNFVTAPVISFDGTGNVAFAATLTPKSVGLGTYTSGDYVKSVVGTSNQITVTGGTGEGSNPVLSFAPNPTIPGNVTIANDLQVNNNLNVTGNITIGGTSAYIISNDFRVKDADIVLGFTTDSFGNDASNDTTANHGGLAIASTEGTPLVQIFNPSIGETNPATYKKIMWFKSGSFAGLNTDAWLINYGVGIGSTQFPSGTRLAAGAVQITENDLAVVRNINASGVVTATTFSGNATSATTAGYATTSGISTVAQGLTGTPNIVVGIVTATRFVGGASSITSLNVSGVSTFASVYSLRQTVSPVSNIYTIDVTSANEFLSSSAFTGVTTVNLSNITSIPTNYVWRGVLRFQFTSGSISWFGGNVGAGYTVKWDGNSAMTPTTNEQEAVIIEIVGAGTTIEVAALRGRT